MTGHFIVMEGGEGCGKSTQLERLYVWLGQQATASVLPAPRVLRTREPGGTELGHMLRGMVLGSDGYRVEAELGSRTELLLYAADRAQHVDEYLRPHLAAGHLVLCDRYTDSTIAYQGYGRGLDRSLIDQLNAIATRGLQSDLTLWLDLSVEEGLARTRKRGAADRMEQSDLAFHRRVRAGFAALAQDHPERIVPIDARGSQEEVAHRIQAVVQKRLEQWYPNR